ncbi:MAG: ATP-binding protein, partial [Clostridium sp.]
LQHLSAINYILVFSAENKNIDHGGIYLYVMYYILSRYECSKIEKIEKEFKIILLVLIVINILSNFYFVNNVFIIAIYAIIVQVLLIVSISNVFKYKLIVENKINVFNVTVISSFIWMNLMEIVGTLQSNILYLIIGAIGSAIFIAASTVIIENISINMYNFIFKDIYDMNKNLEEINSEILKRNEELEKSKKRIEIKQKNYRGFLNSFPKAIIIVSTINNRIIYCNSDFLKLIGVNSYRKIINKKMENIFTIYNNCENLENIKSNDIFLGSTISKKTKQLEIRVSNFSESKKEITMTLEDITEKIKIQKIKGEIERKKINDNIKKNFLSNVSHDFKIPINVIYSATQLENLLIENKDIQGVKKYNSISKQNCLTLIKLTNNIIDISKISAEYVNPALTIGNIVEHIEDRVLSLVEYGKLNNIDIIFDTDNEELYMKYDGELMERIILNLVSNAIKFTPENGNIIVKICSDEKSIYISVEDNGVGMDEKFVKEAFNKYSMDIQSVYGNVQGTGVGLYVVYNLVNLQGGKIWADSKAGNGAKFTMKFNKE